MLPVNKRPKDDVEDDTTVRTVPGPAPLPAAHAVMPRQFEADAGYANQRISKCMAMSPNPSASNEAPTPSSNVLVFPLSDKQIQTLTNEQHLRMLAHDVGEFGSIEVDQGLLKLKIFANLPHSNPIHKLEKRLGILLTLEEVAQIRRDIVGAPADGVDPSSIDVLQLNDRDLFNHMMSITSKGVQFTKHKKRGVSDVRYVMIYLDRLYWKKEQQDRHERDRSFHLSEIKKVLIGKNTKPLKHEFNDDIDDACCFTVRTKRATLDLSTPTMDPIEVRKFVAYLKAFQRHFRDNGHKDAKAPQPRISPIGQGFPGFSFDPEGVRAQMAEMLLGHEAKEIDVEDVEDLYGLYEPAVSQPDQASSPQRIHHAQCKAVLEKKITAIDHKIKKLMAEKNKHLAELADLVSDQRTDALHNDVSVAQRRSADKKNSTTAL